MLDKNVLKILEASSNVPTIPHVIMQVLDAVEDENLSASALASIIERDQALTMRVLTVANSAMFGFSRRISTIDLAIVVMGLKTIKEIVLSLAVQRIFAKVRKDLFDINDFWRYSVFCGAASRVIARRFHYKLAGEAFVAGLIHDIGILMLIQYFPKEFEKMRFLQMTKGLSFVAAEKQVLNCTHADIGAWLVRRWKLPENIENAVLLHHLEYNQAIEMLKQVNKEREREKDESIRISYGESGIDIDENIHEPLTVIVALSEWFAQYMGFKEWALEMNEHSPLFMAEDLVTELQEDDILSPEGVLQVLRQEIIDEFSKSNILTQINDKEKRLSSR